jgi:hypothetical protein
MLDRAERKMAITTVSMPLNGLNGLCELGFPLSEFFLRGNFMRRRLLLQMAQTAIEQNTLASKKKLVADGAFFSEVRARTRKSMEIIYHI